jgi:hypothetical protein
MIENYTFGNIIVDGVTYTSDIKIVRKTVVPNWWRQSGHRVGVADVSDVLDADPDILVLGKGEPGLMTSQKSLRDILYQHNIALIEENTTTAVSTFNRLLKEGKNVAGGFHLSC